MADTTHYDVIVIGAGPAGVEAAMRAATLGAKVAIIERHRTGGTCTITGCVPTRVLAKTARLLRDIRDAHHYGIHTTDPQVIWAETLARVDTVIEHIQHAKRQEQLLRESDATFLVGSAAFTDTHHIRLAGPSLPEHTTLDADKYILCPGGHAAKLAIPGAELALTAENLWTMRTLPKSAAIIGTGATGVQLATVFHELGIKLTLLETASHVLPTEDEDVSQVLAETFAARGIEAITSIAAVDKIETMPDGLRRLTYRTGNESHSLDVDAVFFAVGWPGNTESLTLEKAGVVLNRRWIQVDDYLRTSTEHIFAAGDVTGRMMLVQAATYEANIAAENAVNGPLLKSQHLVVPHGSFTDPEIASVGLTEAQARAQFPDCLVAIAHYRQLERALIDNHPIGLLKLIVDYRTRKLLGAHAAGEQAIGTIQAVAVGLAADITIDQLAALELAYPTYAQIIVSAARQLAPNIGRFGAQPLYKR